MLVGIVGAGTMGTGIAQSIAQSGAHQVYLCDINEIVLANSLNQILSSLSRLKDKDKISAELAEQAQRNISTGDISGCASCDIVIECAPEVMEIKQALFSRLDNICPAQTVFASNTSSLPITEMAASLSHSLVGMHFFNPAPLMKLVEVIRGDNTPDCAVARIKGLATSIGKEPIEVIEAPGFVVNRILIPMINEAILVLQEGTSSRDEIDTAMRLGANHPMGPLALADLIGLDVVLEIMEQLRTETGDQKYRPAQLLKKMVRAGRLGRKTGDGFYQY